MRIPRKLKKKLKRRLIDLYPYISNKIIIREFVKADGENPEACIVDYSKFSQKVKDAHYESL